MDQAEFQDWLSEAGRLTSAQRAKAADALSTDTDEKISVAAVDRGVGCGSADLGAAREGCRPTRMARDWSQ